MMKIAVLEPLNIPDRLLDDLVQPLRALGHEIVWYADRAKNATTLLQRSIDSDIVIIGNTSYPASVIMQLERTKLIDVAFTGVDHVDLEACVRKGIMVCNASGYATQAVAEQTIGMTLALYRHLIQCDGAIRLANRYAGVSMGQEIAGKTVGIVGTGAIGMATARLFHAFGASLLGFNRSVHSEAKTLGMRYCGLNELLTSSDIVSVHLPQTRETYHLLNAEALSHMQPHAVLINVARGSVIDAKALAEALRAGQIAGAAIDVFDNEPPLSYDHPLLHAPNCLLTPHTAYRTQEAMKKRATIAFANALAFVESKPMPGALPSMGKAQ